ncbi:MAG: SRPBCC family protein [Halanaeroarchaeum sp.]
MRTVSVTRHVGAPPTAVRHHLDPMTLVDAEGTFRAIDRLEEDDGVTVVAKGGGMEVAFRFVETDAGYEYEQQGEAGPFETMRTTVTIEPEDEGSRVTMESTVSLGLPLAAVTDRVAAWKRKGELERALSTIAEDV